MTENDKELKLSDEALRDLQEAEQDVAEGRLIPFEQIKKDLDL